MQQLEFELRGEFVELNQLLKLSGVCDSGGAGKMLVAEGVVSSTATDLVGSSNKLGVISSSVIVSFLVSVMSGIFCSCSFVSGSTSLLN